MELLETMDTVARQEWLDPASDSVQRVVGDALHPPGRAGAWLDNVLNGTWLGHPLHPVVTDVPVGAWTVGLLLDGLETLTPKKELAAGADAANWIGIAGALGAAVTGLAQWQYTVDRQKRLGMAHALLNTGALALYSASAVLRACGRRGAGKLAALLGYAVVAASAYIGGDLVYAEHIGVSHVPEESPPAEFTPALPEAELPEGAMVRVAVGGVPILLARQNGTIYAISAVCAHLGGPLEEGTLNADCSVTCPWHGSRFALDDGRLLNGPATFPQPHYETRVRSRQIEVRPPRTIDEGSSA
jgi:nitrite reductase/ring-hydroxylating ferredoxin subunit/uncharacterized membrane protein